MLARMLGNWGYGNYARLTGFLCWSGLQVACSHGSGSREMAAAGGAGASQAVEPSAGSASSDAGAASSSGESGGRGGAGNNGGSSPSAGNAGTVSVAGAGGAYDLAGGLQILDLPKCDGVDAQACNGACVGLDAELNGCLFLTGGSVFSDMASDADGTFFAIREGSAASITTLDPELGEMTQVLRKLGSNLAFDLSLTSQDLFYVAALNYGAENALWRLPRSGGTATLLLDGLPHVSTFAASERQLFLQEYSAAKLHRFELDGTGDTVFMRSTTALAADGNDLYFLERDSNAQGHLYRAVSGDVEGAELIGDIAAGQIKGFADDWVLQICRALHSLQPGILDNQLRDKGFV